MTERLETVRYGNRCPSAPDNFDEYFTFTRNFRAVRIDDRPFQAWASFWSVGDFAVTEQKMGAVRATRSADRLVASPAGHLTAVVLFDGDFNYVSDVAGPAGPGDMLLLDYLRPFEFETHGHHGATISLPRHLLEDRPGRLAVHGRLPSTAETRLFADLVRSLVTQLPDLPLASAPMVSTVLRHLLQGVVSQLGSPVVDPAVSEAYQRACAYIENSPPGVLDVATMTMDLGMGRSRLYDLFRMDGGVLAYDRRRRLRLLHLALIEDPSGAKIGDIAARFGFMDPSTVARQFRQHFGHSMGAVRRHLPPPPRSASMLDDPLCRFRSAVEDLSS